jgi:hypothetical protein
MIDAQAPLQAAIVAAVEADAGLGALIGDRIYDKVPTTGAGQVSATFPYVSFGPMQSVPSDDECHDGVEVTVQLDAWSRKPGTVEVRQIVAGLTRLLDAALTVTGFEVVTFEVQSARTGREADGLTSRGIVQLRYELAPTT